MKKPVRAKRGGSDSRSLRVTTMANTYGKREGEAGLGRERLKLQCNSKKRSVKSMAVLKLTSSFFLRGGGPISHRNDLHWYLHHAWSLVGSSSVGIYGGGSKRTIIEVVNRVCSRRTECEQFFLMLGMSTSAC